METLRCKTELSTHPKTEMTETVDVTTSLIRHEVLGIHTSFSFAHRWSNLSTKITRPVRRSHDIYYKPQAFLTPHLPRARSPLTPSTEPSPYSEGVHRQGAYEPCATGLRCCY